LETISICPISSSTLRISNRTHDGNIIAASIPFIELIKEMKVQSGNCKLPKRTLRSSRQAGDEVN